MVEFGGYDMPVQYPEGIMADTTGRARTRMFDVSTWGQLPVAACWAASEAHRKAAIVEKLVPSDIAGLAPGKVAHRAAQRAGRDRRRPDDGWPPREDMQGGLYVVVNAGRRERLRVEDGRTGGASADDRALIALQGRSKR
jgi:aminomethyltransferase